jgi:NitT/TauT family transport system permease protein
LTGAELLGASSGLGYFVKKFSDFADYTKVIAGIILMGVVVTILVAIIQQLQKKLIKWQYT